MTRWDIPIIEDTGYGKLVIFLRPDHRVEPEDAGLFRATVAEVRLDRSATPEEVMARVTARLAGAGAFVPETR